MKRTLGVCYYPEHWPKKLWKEDYSFEPNPDDNTKSIIRLWENRVPRVLS